MHTAELHISSLLVHVTPRRLDAVDAAVRTLAGACVHAASPAGKMVVTLEHGSVEAMTAAIADVQQMPGVLSVALVYQCADTFQAMNEEMPDAQT